MQDEILKQADEIIERERSSHEYYTNRGFSRVKNPEAVLIEALVNIIREKEEALEAIVAHIERAEDPKELYDAKDIAIQALTTTEDK